jgi:beta-aspartyl-peptidase (threonine type)
MKKIFSLVMLCYLFINKQLVAQNDNLVIVIHGGAGTWDRALMTADKEKAYKDKLNEALEAGMKVLKEGGTSLQAIETAIKILEDSPLFNAGKGAVFTNEGKNELDASVMDGKTLKAGAVAGVTTIKNPISAAIAVMEKSEHVMMVGQGAEKFAASKGIEIVPPSYFYTEERYQQLKKAQEKEKAAQEDTTGSVETDRNYKFGTVGAVALDKFGNLAAGTSTGGMTNKRYGRVGDAPIIGAGTYANNEACAVSCTGHGEYFIRWTVARDIAALVEYKKMSVEKAGNEVIMNKMVKAGGEGGCIILDKKGKLSMPFNSEGMYRGYLRSNGEKSVMIYKDK